MGPTTPRGEQPSRPLPDYRIGPNFLASLHDVPGVSTDKVADVTVEIITGVVHNACRSAKSINRVNPKARRLITSVERQTMQFAGGRPYRRGRLKRAESTIGSCRRHAATSSPGRTRRRLPTLVRLTLGSGAPTPRHLAAVEVDRHLGPDRGFRLPGRRAGSPWAGSQVSDSSEARQSAQSVPPWPHPSSAARLVMPHSFHL